MSKFMKNKVSVIIPTLNEEKYIANCIYWLKNQSIKPYEIIIVDDDSSDRTREIAKSLGCKVVHRKQEEIDKNFNTIATARNLGAAVARGNYLFFIDADTHLVDKNWIAKALYLINKKSLDAIVGRFGCYDCKCFTERFLILLWLSISLFFYLVLRIPFFPSPCCLFIKKQVFKKVSGYPIYERAEDAAFTRLLSRKFKIKLCFHCYSQTSARRMRKMGYPKFLLYWLKYYAKRFILRKLYVPEYLPVR